MGKAGGGAGAAQGGDGAAGAGFCSKWKLEHFGTTLVF